MADYFPEGNPKRTTWLTNYKAKVAAIAARYGATPAQVTDTKADADAILTSIATLVDAERTYRAAITAVATAIRTHFPPIRKLINYFKGNPNWQPADGRDLDALTAAETPVDPAAYRPDIEAEAFGGFTRITFQLRGVDRLNLYWRKRGETPWRFLATDTNPPYDDHTPLTNPEVPEVREYQAWGVLDDQQIGQPSAIVTATFGG